MNGATVRAFAAAPASLLAFVLFAATPLAAQGVPSLEELEKTVQRLRDQVRFRALKQPTDEEAAALEQGEAELARFVETMTTLDGASERHYLLPIDAFLALYPSHALQLATAGLRRFPDSLQLLQASAIANFHVADQSFVNAARVHALQEAERTLRRMTALGCDSWTVHAGLARALDGLDRCEEALAELDAVALDPDGARDGTHRPLQRVSLLMRAGRPKDALALLRAAAPGDATTATIDRLVLGVRACALAGDLVAARAAITSLREADHSTRALVESAAALAHLGENADALQLLATRPALAANADAGSDDTRWSRMAAATEALLRADDVSPAGPLRMALTTALDLHCWMGSDETRHDFNTSPIVMAKMLGGMGMPEHPITVQGDHVLFVLCALAAPTHQPSGNERVLLDVFAQDGPIPDATDVPARLLAIRRNVGDPEIGGALTALRVIDKLTKSAPAAAKPTAK